MNLDARRPRGRGAMAALREYAPLLALFVTFLLARVAWTGGGWPIDPGLARSYGLLFGIMAVLAFLGLWILHAFTVTHRSPGTRAAFRTATWAAFGREYLGAHRLTCVLLTWGILTLFMPLFLHWKAEIGASIPFRWDDPFIRLDRLLHLGRHPWEWLHPLLARPGVTVLLDRLYHPGWTVGVLLFLPTAAAWSARRRLAIRILFAYLLVWIIVGTVFAYLFASAGPVYLSHLAVSAEEPYEELLTYLAGVDRDTGLFSVTASAVMWTELSQGIWPRIGIAAMPSVHVGLTFLLVFPAFQLHRILGGMAGAYVIIMQLGSVHLGWHYAIDGYLAILLTALIWWMTGVFLDRFWPKSAFSPQPHVSQLPEPPAR